MRWVPLMQGANPEISIRAESALEPELMQGLVEGRIDIGVMYTPAGDFRVSRSSSRSRSI